MKIAISGKGGAGKTTIAAGLTRLLAKEGLQVLAIDADPDANLGLTIGFTKEELAKIRAISEMPELIAERTGTYPGSMGGFFKLNPKVSDLPDKLAAVKDSIKLLVLGTVEKGGGGCICPESALLKALLNHIVLERDEAVIMDMEAGIEHLGRATAMGVDALIIVVEPGLRSVQTAQKISKLADDIKIKKKLLVLNKIRDWREEETLQLKLPDLTFIGSVAELEEIREADLTGQAPFDVSEQFVSQIKKIRAGLANVLANSSQGQIGREAL